MAANLDPINVVYQVWANWAAVNRWLELSEPVLPYITGISEMPITDVIVYGGHAMHPHYAEWKALTNKLRERLFKEATPFSVERWQMHLRNNKFDPGAIDGIVGGRSIEALKLYQQSRGLKADGWMGPRTETQMRTEGA